MIERTYPVSGMNCGHCAQSVTEELTALPGVTDVGVDVAAGQVVVRSEAPLDLATVRDAVEEAGFQLGTGVVGV
ncbi:MAG TPA: heavy metal-associated domain-containing protein [Amycolatopsis sp.]|nr:heavy metal-associated domain-containing protein [Amycolatopsis sp.]